MISNVEVIPVEVPLKAPAKMAHGLITHQGSAIVRISTDDGRSGIGAVEPIPGHDLESLEEVVSTVKDIVKPLIMGKKSDEIKNLVALMDGEFEGHMCSKAVVEMALFDLLGKSLNGPVDTFFGGRIKDTVSLNGWVGIGSPDKARSDAREWLNKGFTAMKLKMGSDVTSAVEMIKAVREEVGADIELRVDANEALNMDKARATIEGLKHLDIRYIEQPFPREKIDDLAILSRTSPIPLMADESVEDLHTLLIVLRQEAAQFVKVKVQKMGGLLKTHQAIQVADTFGVPVILGHGFGMGINTQAELHLAASTNAVMDGCESVGPLRMKDDVVKDNGTEWGGQVKLTALPGLGVELDEEKIKKYRID